MNNTSLRLPLILLAAVIIIGFGGAWAVYKAQAPTVPVLPTTTSTRPLPTAPATTSGAPTAGYSGARLAGNLSPLLDFNSADYAQALASNKLVVVYFYANWCPECRVEFPVAEQAFNELTSDQVIGFRVNYNDDQTDAAEKALAQEYGVAYQHTKVFVKNGQRLLKSPETWTKERYLAEITKALTL